MTAAEINDQLVSHLKALHLPTIRACYEEVAEMARREALSFEHYLLEIIEHEQEVRHQHRIERLLRESHLPLDAGGL